MKLCIDCRFAELVTTKPDNPEWMCSHPTSLFHQERSPVTGIKPEPVPLSCKWARAFINEGRCDREGRHWEARP